MRPEKSTARVTEAEGQPPALPRARSSSSPGIGAVAAVPPAPPPTVIVPTVTPRRVSRLLDSLSGAGGSFETVVVDNGTGSAELKRSVANLDGGELLRLPSNQGYSRAVNLAARSAQGEVLVLLNDDSVVDEGYVERIAEALDPALGIVMATGVMRDAGNPELIETAGVELDRTLLPFDHLNGEPVEILEQSVPDPIGPSGAAAAFWRDAFLEAGGFDEELFAYFEDVDLVLRMRLAGGSCRLAPRARGTHEHSATLGPGSRQKDYLIGYGRGYLLRKWGVLTPRRMPGIVVRELALSTGQMLIDRNLGGARGRLHGLRATPERRPYPAEALGDPASLLGTMSRRWRRRARIRRRPL
jgi:N-acetylglucosaminyl-diphospho-decaprenol L-rhamnosyltransferase